ncbi:MAG: hypothetical protein HQL38_15385 [Alphaproteobacteria bacterium]|nr:hypothetical protein [Alphaproteobacteria bacterium]
MGDRKNRWVVFGSFAMLGVFGFALFENEVLPVEILAVIWGVGILLQGTWFALFGDDAFDLFSPGCLTNICFAILYGVALLTVQLEPSGYFTRKLQTLSPYYAQVGFASYWGVLGFNLGYHLVQRPLARRFLPKMGDVSGSQAFWLWLILIAIGTTIVLIGISSRIFLQTNRELESPLFVSAVGFFMPFLHIAVALAAMQSMRRFTVASSWTYYFMISIAVLLVYTIPSGSKFNWVVGIILVAMAFNYTRRLFRRDEAVVGIIGLFALLSILMPLNTIYRDAIIARDSSGQQSLGQAFSLLADTATNVGTILPFSGADDGVEAVRNDYMRSRLSNIGIVAEILRYQERGGALRNGITYSYALLGLIPRVVWPDKPELTVGREISRVVMGNDQDDVTSVGVTLIGEAIYNFGPYSVFFVLTGIGALMGFLYYLFKNFYRTNPVMAFMMHVGVWFNLYYPAQESNIAGGIAGSVKILVFLMILFYFVTQKRPTAIGSAIPPR